MVDPLEIRVGCPPSEVSRQFLQGMADRMAVSFHKYGKVADAYPVKVDAINSLMTRLRKYRDTGNTEWLMGRRELRNDRVHASGARTSALCAHGFSRHPPAARSRWGAIDTQRTPRSALIRARLRSCHTPSIRSG